MDAAVVVVVVMVVEVRAMERAVEVDCLGDGAAIETIVVIVGRYWRSIALAVKLLMMWKNIQGIHRWALETLPVVVGKCSVFCILALYRLLCT